MGEEITNRQNYKLRIAVRDFAQPLQRKGSLGSKDASGLTLDVGQEIHESIQEQLASNFANYEREYHLNCILTYEDFEFMIVGRCDGLYVEEVPRLEEIKSSYHLESLKQELDQDLEHPYRLQIKTYLYLYFQKTQVVPEGSLRLVCSRSGKQEVLPITFDPIEFGRWVEQRCQLIAKEYEDYLEIVSRRKRLSAELEFPFKNIRPSQKELIEFVQKAIKKHKQLMIQAPTGLGKTAGIIYPSLKRALRRGAPLLYLAPKNSQFKAAVDFAKACQSQGVSLTVFVMTARSKSCLNDQINCTGTACEYALNYYEKRTAAAVELKSTRSVLWERERFRDIGLVHKVCPYQIALEHLREADLIICDYNYLASLRPSFFENYDHPYLPVTKPSLVIDEAHNLYSRAIENFSPSLPRQLVLEWDQKERDRPRTRDRFLTVLKQTLALFQPLARQDQPDRQKISELIEELDRLIMDMLIAGKDIPSDDPIWQLYQIFQDFIYFLNYDGEEIKWLRYCNQSDEILKVLCLDPAPFLQPVWSRFERVIAFSATLKPFPFYLHLSGFDPAKSRTAEFSCPFPRQHKKILIIPQITTTLRERPRQYARIAEVIHRLVPLKRGHYFVFFPSYQFQSEVAQRLRIEDLNMKVLYQSGNLTQNEMETYLKQINKDSEPCLLLAVQGGSFAEGLDFRGQGVKGVFVVGPAIPAISPERQQMARYYEKRYGSGYQYTYVYPAMARSVQSAGRIIRDELEQGLIVLLDRRFLEPAYFQSMPSDWFLDHPKELISNQILSDVNDFWQSFSINSELGTIRDPQNLNSRIRDHRQTHEVQ